MPGTPFSTDVRTLAQLTVLELHGDINRDAQSGLEAAYRQAEDRRLPVVLNFTDTDYINSTGIAVIVGILAMARTKGLGVGAFGLSDHYRRIFEITRLSDFMTVHADQQAALAAG
jgi:anti-anti-sigma factor